MGTVGRSTGAGAVKGTAVGLNPALLAATGGLSAPIGALVGGAIGFFAGKKKQKNLDEQERKRLSKLNITNRNLVLDQSKQLLNTYPINGQEGNISFENGGQLPSNIGIDKNKVKKITEDLFLIKGNTHENNGVKIDSNGDDIVDAEVERDEVYQDSKKRIFSDNLEPNEKFKEAIKSQFNIPISGTYANSVKQLSSKIKDDESKFQGKFDKETKDITNKKIYSALDSVFEDQENSKIQTQEQEFKNGGEMKKYEGGGEVIQGLESDYNISGQLLNLGSFLSNRDKVKNLQTDRTPVLNPNPVFTYKDNSGRLINKLDTNTRETINSINRGSSQNNSRAIAETMANKFNAISDINTASNVQENNQRNIYADRLAQTQAQNAAIVNNTEEGNLDRRNQQKALLSNAENAFFQGITGNIETAKQNKMQGAELLLTAVQQGDRGTITRLLQQFPELAKTLGIDVNQLLNDPEMFNETINSNIDNTKQLTTSGFTPITI